MAEGVADVRLSRPEKLNSAGFDALLPLPPLSALMTRTDGVLMPMMLKST